MWGITSTGKNTQNSIKHKEQGGLVTESTPKYEYENKIDIRIRKSPLGERNPASGLKVMDPETQILQEHGCRIPVSLARKSFIQKDETMLSDRHRIPE